MINDHIIIQSHLIYFRKPWYIDCDLKKKKKKKNKLSLSSPSKPSIQTHPKATLIKYGEVKKFQFWSQIPTY